MSQDIDKTTTVCIRMPVKLKSSLESHCTDISVSEFCRYLISRALNRQTLDKPSPSEFRALAARVLGLLGATGISETIARLKDAGRNSAPALTPEEHEAVMTLEVSVGLIKDLLLEALRMKERREE